MHGAPQVSGSRRGRRTALACVLLLLGFVLLTLTAPVFWLGELAASLRWQFAVAALAAAAMCLLLRAWRPALVASVIAVWSAWPEASLSFGDTADEAVATGAPELTVLCANVRWSNDRFAEVIELVEREDPDVVALIEVSRAGRPVYDEGLLGRYPQRVEALNTAEWWAGTWGIVLYSKQPLVRGGALPIPGTWPRTRPAVEAVLLLDGEPLTLHVVHAPRAGSRDWNETRDHVLFALASREPQGRSEDGPAGGPGEGPDEGPKGERLWLGDFNATSNSSGFQRALARSGLRDTRRGFGRQPSFDAAAQLPVPLLRDLLSALECTWIAIDQALVSDGLAVLERRVVDVPGSDHRAVIVRIARR